MKKDAHSLQDYIRLEAFLLSEKAGHPSGMDEFFWAQAEEMVHGRTAVVVGPGKPAKTKTKPKAATAPKVKAAKKTPSAKSEVLPKAKKPAKPKAKSAAKHSE